MKSPIRWVGGKSKSVNLLLQLIPQHDTYIEPFFGGGWLFFAKEKSKVEIINDINDELMNFYMVVLNNYEEFKNKFKYLIPSRYLFNQWKNDASDLSEVDRAVRFYYINRTCFSGDMQRPRFGSSNIRRSNLCVVTDDFDIFMKPIHERLKDTYIESLDFREIFKRYDFKESTKEKREVFFFVDPPYKETYGYEHEFSNEDHEELADILYKINGKFLLTINDDEYIKELYKDFNIITNEVMYKICKDIKGIGKRNELIITNYDIEVILLGEKS